jgi:glycolate oxidase FAD binding subunit
VWLEGWTDEVEEQTAAARSAAADIAVDHHPAPFDPLGIGPPTIVEAAVAPSRIPEVVAGREGWSALLGVGLVWFALDGNDPDALDAIRSKVTEAGGIAPVIKGRGGLGPAAVPAVDVHRRLKESFDPAGILSPGRSWDGLESSSDELA